MFILLALLMLIDYTADSEKFLFAYRFQLAGMPVNILDVLVAVASLAAVVSIFRRKYPGEKAHRGFKWSISLLFMACMTGALGGFRHSVEMREIADFTRNVATMACCIFIGYASISTLRGVRWASYLLLISSAASALFVILFMRESIETLKWSSNSFDELRSTARGGDVGMVGTAFLAFSAVMGMRFFPRIIGWGLFALCTAGTFAMPHRALWLCGALTILFAVLILPTVPAGRKIGSLAVLSLLMMVVLGTGVVAYAHLTGRNLQDYVGVRLRSMLPGVEETRDNKAWDTRLPGIFKELEIWMESPLIGGGFGIQKEREHQVGGVAGAAYRHNVWTSALAEGGLPLFLGYLLTCLLCLVIGFRLVRLRMDQGTFMMGAIASLHGFMSLLLAGMTMTFNQQRAAIPLGLICGLVLRTRDMQLAVANSYDGYLDADDGQFILPPEGQYD